MKKLFKLFRNVFLVIAGILIVLFLVSYISSRIELYEQQEKFECIANIVSLGDDIYEARSMLINEGFRCEQIVFSDNLSFGIRLKGFDSLNGLEYALNMSIRPWRNQLVLKEMNR